MSSVLLSKSMLLSGEKLRTMDLELPELGGAVKLREPSSAAAMRVRELQARAQPKRGPSSYKVDTENEGELMEVPGPIIAPGEDVEADLMAEMIASTVLDEHGNLAFSRGEALQVLDRIPLATSTRFVKAFNQLIARTPPPAPALVEGGVENPSKPS